MAADLHLFVEKPVRELDVQVGSFDIADFAC